MMNITLYQLNVLNAVKEHGSVTMAARALHITQPAVSNILKQLELNYAYPLTEKIGKRIYLTHAGERLIQSVGIINDELEKAAFDINMLHNKSSGTMNVAIVSTAKYFVPKLLGQFRQLYPGIKIKLTVCNRHDAIKILKENSNDFLIMSQLPDDVPIKKKPFYQDQLVVAASPKFQFKTKIKNLKQLEHEEWIIREPGSGTRIVMKKLFKKYKMLPNISMEVGNNESIKQLIMANMGISIVSRQSIELELKHKLIKILPIAEFPLHHTWHIVMNKGKLITRAMNDFFNFVTENKDYHN